MSIIIMILLLSLLILVHEVGHFMAARAFGIRVDKFGFGLPFGPTLFKTKCGQTEILIHAFLLGGYVSFPDDEKDCDLPEDSPERFINKPLWQRSVVISAGVIANVLCAFALVMLVAAWHKQLPSGDYEIFIKEINTTEQTLVLDSGLQAGDKVVGANGCDINNQYSFKTILTNSAKNNGTILQDTVDKNYELLKGLNPGLQKDEIIPAELSIRLPKTPVSDSITMDKYEAKGAKRFKKDGYKLNNNLIPLREAVENKTVYTSDGKYTLYNVAEVLSDGVHPVVLIVLREGKEIELKAIYPNEKGLIGVMLETKPIMLETNSPIAIIKGSSIYLWENTRLMIYSLGQLFTGKVDKEDLHGVVAITKLGGDMIERSGTGAGLLLAALISMNLALLNILPIPALDGGHLMFLLIEKISGKPVDDKIVEKISTVFFYLLIILMIFIVFNDFVYIFQK